MFFNEMGLLSPFPYNLGSTLTTNVIFTYNTLLHQLWGGGYYVKFLRSVIFIIFQNRQNTY